MTNDASGRDAAISHATGEIDNGNFERVLARRVAIPSASRVAACRPELERYLVEEIKPHFERMGFTVELFRNDIAPGPFLLAERIEGDDLTTVLQYGHGDVVAGLDDSWSEGLSPFAMTRRGERWYGRGTADNKGQHSVNMAAIEAVLAERGHLGFNLKYLVEMAEESGSIGLEEFCSEHRNRLKADVFIASDGPRLALDDPTIFLGARGGISFGLEVNARQSFQHSGNWGGLLSSPAIQLCHAITALVERTGRIRVRDLTPGEIPGNVKTALRACKLAPQPDDPAIEEWWGEPGLSAEEKVFAWSSLDVMEMECGRLDAPLSAIPPKARARMQLRFPVGVDVEGVVPAVRKALAEAGFDRVEVKDSTDAIFKASRLDPDHPWVRKIASSIERTLGRAPSILPNLGGSLPNNIFCDLLGLPTIWIPHSYSGCLQHAPDEHLPISVAREGLAMMAGIYWDIGAPGGD